MIVCLLLWAIFCFMITLSRLFHARFYVHLLFKVHTNCNHVSITLWVLLTCKPMSFTRCRISIPRNSSYFILAGAGVIYIYVCVCVFTIYGKVLLWQDVWILILSFLHPTFCSKIPFHRFCLEKVSWDFRLYFMKSCSPTLCPLATEIHLKK